MEATPAAVVEEAPATKFEHEIALEECPVCEHDMCQCPPSPKQPAPIPEPPGEPSYKHSWNASKMIRPMGGGAHDHGHSTRGKRIR